MAAHRRADLGFRPGPDHPGRRSRPSSWAWREPLTGQSATPYREITSWVRRGFGRRSAKAVLRPTTFWSPPSPPLRAGVSGHCPTAPHHHEDRRHDHRPPPWCRRVERKAERAPRRAQHLHLRAGARRVSPRPLPALRPPRRRCGHARRGLTGRSSSRPSSRPAGQLGSGNGWPASYRCPTLDTRHPEVP